MRSTIVFCGELLKEPVGGPCSPFTGKEVGWGQRKETWLRSLEASLPRREMDEKSPGKFMQGYGLG